MAVDALQAQRDERTRVRNMSRVRINSTAFIGNMIDRVFPNSTATTVCARRYGEAPRVCRRYSHGRGSTTLSMLMPITWSWF